MTVDPVNKEPSRSEIVREERWLESWTLWAIPVALVVSVLMAYAASDGTKEVWFIAGNVIIALGYFFFAINIAPYFDVDRDTKLAAILFFFTCAATHIELASHAAFDADGMSIHDMRSWHMLFIHTLQPFAIWRFVLGLQKAAIIDRQRLKNLVVREEDVQRREAELGG